MCDSVGERHGGERDKMGREGNELMWVGDVPKAQCPRLYSHRKGEEKVEATMQVTQVKCPKVFASLIWMSGCFSNLINPDNWYGGSSLMTSNTRSPGQTLLQQTRRVSMVLLKLSPPFQRCGHFINIATPVPLSVPTSGTISSGKLEHCFPAKPNCPGLFAGLPLCRNSLHCHELHVG